MKESVEFLLLRVEALEKENERLNKELMKLKMATLEVKLTDPAFFRPINHLKVKL